MTHDISTNSPMGRISYMTLPRCKGTESCGGRKAHGIFSITNPPQLIPSALYLTKISQSYNYQERYPSYFASVNKNVVITNLRPQTLLGSPEI